MTDVQLIDNETATKLASLESDPKLNPIVKALAYISNGIERLTKSKKEEEEDEDGKDDKSTSDYSGQDYDDDADEDDEDDNKSEDGDIGKSYYDYDSDVATEVGTMFDEAVDRVCKATISAIGAMMAKQRDDVLAGVDRKIEPMRKSLAEVAAMNETISKAMGQTATNLQKSAEGRERLPVAGYAVRDSSVDALQKGISQKQLTDKLIKAVQAGDFTTEVATDLSERIQKHAAGMPALAITSEHLEILSKY